MGYRLKHERFHSLETRKDDKKAMRFSKLATFFASAALSLGIGTAIVTGLSSAASPVYAASNDEETSEPSLPESETELTADSLRTSVTSSSSTDRSHSFGVRFSSSIKTYANQSRYKNIYVAIDDPNFVSEDDAKSLVERDENGNVVSVPTYKASVYAIFGTPRAYSNVVIPSVINVSEKFDLKITSITSGCMPTNAGSLNEDKAYQYIKSIIIPDTVETIGGMAFKNVPESVTIKCQAPSRPDDWVEGWTDAKNVEWGYAPTDKESADLVQGGGSTKEFSSGESFVLGTNQSGEYYKPLLVSYDTKDKAGKVLQKGKVAAIPLTSTNANYDALGLGQTTLNITFDLEKSADEVIDPHSLVFHNIYKPARVDGNVVPDLEQGAFYTVPTLSYGEELSITQLIEYKTVTLSSYVGYLDFNFEVNKVPGVYQKIKPAIYSQNETGIQAGTRVVRTLIYSVNTCSYRVTYLEEGKTLTKSIRITSPVDFVLLDKEKGNDVGYSLHLGAISPKIAISDIVSVDLIGVTIKLDIYNNDTAKSITKSDVVTRFGVVELYSNKDAIRSVDIASFLLIWFFSYVGVFLLGALAYYFYAKNRFKNDEFRRMNTKRYLSVAGKNFLGFGIIALAILYNIARWVYMNTTVVAYNPLDAYLIVFTVAGFIFLGFFIKSVVTSVKNAMKRREALRLKLDQDVADDGTH